MTETRPPRQRQSCEGTIDENAGGIPNRNNDMHWNANGIEPVEGNDQEHGGSIGYGDCGYDLKGLRS